MAQARIENTVIVKQSENYSYVVCSANTFGKNLMYTRQNKKPNTNTNTNAKTNIKNAQAQTQTQARTNTQTPTQR